MTHGHPYFLVEKNNYCSIAYFNDDIEEITYWTAYFSYLNKTLFQIEKYYLSGIYPSNFNVYYMAQKTQSYD